MSINSTGLNGRGEGTDSSKEGLNEESQLQNQKSRLALQKPKRELSKRLFSQYHKREVGTEGENESPSQNPDTSLKAVIGAKGFFSRKSSRLSNKIDNK